MKRHHALAAIVLAALAVVGAVLFVVPRFAADPAGPAEMAGAPQPEPAVTVSQARLVMPASGTEAAVYLDITNRADATLYLTEAARDASGQATLAYLRTPEVKEATSLAIPAGETLRLAPESGFAIITGYDASVVPGATVPLTLTFSDGNSVRVPLEVQSMVGQNGVVRLPSLPVRQGEVGQP